MMDHTHRIIFLSATYEGSTHDKTITDQEGYTLPADSILVQDTGYQGVMMTNVTIYQPKKKPRNGTLTAEEKIENQHISRMRIPIEHTLASVKRWRILKDICRLTRHQCLDLIMRIGCGLHNFIIQQRQWKVIDFKP